jgi:hypothetical protein
VTTIEKSRQPQKVLRYAPFPRKNPIANIFSKLSMAYTAVKTIPKRSRSWL